MCAEPEILHWDIRPEDKFAVVASDGVFEFITSQNVAEMLAKFSDPIEAAKHVVAEVHIMLQNCCCLLISCIADHAFNLNGSGRLWQWVS